MQIIPNSLHAGQFFMLLCIFFQILKQKKSYKEYHQCEKSGVPGQPGVDPNHFSKVITWADPEGGQGVRPPPPPP